MQASSHFQRRAAFSFPRQTRWAAVSIVQTPVVRCHSPGNQSRIEQPPITCSSVSADWIAALLAPRRPSLPPPSLYRRLLGPRFDELPETLRRFHDAAGGGKAQGVFQVKRGRGWLRNTVASLLGFPRAGTDVPVVLDVVVAGDRERWCRDFAGKKLVSTQWEHGELLIEKFGVGSFSSRVRLDGADLVYEFCRAWLAGVPLPSWLARARLVIQSGKKTRGRCWSASRRRFLAR